MMRVSAFLLFTTIYNVISGHEIDSKGYLVYCPCMGRFGNQADQFLGSLSFARSLDRTLVVPPWVEYRPGVPGSSMKSWDSYFNISVLSSYHRVITMEQFMEDHADIVWPQHKRISLCYTARHGKAVDSCNAKEGNPFGPFWDHSSIDFEASAMFSPLSYGNPPSEWTDKFPPSQFPVLSFTGPPASFPVVASNVGLQKYMEWSDPWMKKGRDWIKEHLPPGPFIGLHLRNGADWDRACDHVNITSNLFSSPQCLGYRNEAGQITKELCKPSLPVIVKQIKRAVKNVGAVSVFVASDNDHMLEEFRKQFKRGNIISFHKQGGQSSPHLDLIILGQSNFFIGNCVSSFSAFVKRERDVFGLPSAFWAFPPDNRQRHEEL